MTTFGLGMALVCFDLPLATELDPGTASVDHDLPGELD